MIAAGSIVGESLADRQLAAWRSVPANRGRTARNGLWGWSRHPNYFFEWLHWVGWAVIAVASPHGWLAIVVPLFLLLLLFRVTGIPETEAQALRSRGDDYRRYQREVSGLRPAAATKGFRRMKRVVDRVVADGWLPDPLLRGAIKASCGIRLRREERRGLDALGAMLAALSSGPLAVDTDAANAQHYEVDPAFFGLDTRPSPEVLGLLLADAAPSRLRQPRTRCSRSRASAPGSSTG